MGQLLDKTIFKDEMKKLELIFNYDFNVDRARIYYDLLKDEMSNESFAKACVKIAKTERFFPVPSVIFSHSEATTRDEVLKKYGF